MTFVLENLSSGDNKTFIDYTEQMRNLTDDIRKANSTSRLLQTPEEDDTYIDPATEQFTFNIENVDMNDTIK